MNSIAWNASYQFQVQWTCYVEDTTSHSGNHYTYSEVCDITNLILTLIFTEQEPHIRLIDIWLHLQSLPVECWSCTLSCLRHREATSGSGLGFVKYAFSFLVLEDCLKIRGHSVFSPKSIPYACKISNAVTSK